MNNIWGHYDLKAWKFDDLTVLCAVWFIIIKRFRILRNLLLFFEFRYYPFYYYYYYYYYLFSVPPFARENLKNRNAFSHQTSHTCRPSPLIVHLIFFEPIRITILDLEPDPCFKIFLNISKTNYRIFNCNMPNRRSGQELPFIFFELRAATCLWGRYDPKTENFTLFYIYLLHIHSYSKTIYVSLKGYPRATFHVLVAKVYVVTWAHYVTKSKIPLFA